MTGSDALGKNAGSPTTRNDRLDPSDAETTISSPEPMSANRKNTPRAPS